MRDVPGTFSISKGAAGNVWNISAGIYYKEHWDYSLSLFFALLLLLIRLFTIIAENQGISLILLAFFIKLLVSKHWSKLIEI